MVSGSGAWPKALSRDLDDSGGRPGHANGRACVNRRSGDPWLWIKGGIDR